MITYSVRSVRKSPNSSKHAGRFSNVNLFAIYWSPNLTAPFSGGARDHSRETQRKGGREPYSAVKKGFFANTTWLLWA